MVDPGLIKLEETIAGDEVKLSVILAGLSIISTGAPLPASMVERQRVNQEVVSGTTWGSATAVKKRRSNSVP